MSNNNSSKTQHNFLNAPNYPLPLKNNGVGMHQNQNLMQPFLPNMQQIPMNTPPFMNVANNLIPLQNNNQLHLPHLSHNHVGGLGQTLQNNANYNPMFQLQGQVMQNTAQVNLSHLQGQILAQSILNMLQQQPNVNMNMYIPNGQFCAPYPVQNMNQQLPMQVSNPSQVVPYGMHLTPRPMFGFPNQVPQTMVPQNPIFSANPQLGLVTGNQVRPQIDPNEKKMVPPTVNTNAFVSSSPFPSQQLQGNSSAPPNPNLTQPHRTNNCQPSAVMNSYSQENSNGNVKTNVPKSNWKVSPGKNFKNKPNRGSFQGGFQKSKFHDINDGKRRNGFPKKHKGKESGANYGRAGQVGLNSKEHNPEPKRSFSVTYTEQEIQQWREARRKNHPFSDNIQKKQSEYRKDSKVIDREVLHRELKDVLEKQAELGIEVAEIPSYYLKNYDNQCLLQSEGKKTFSEKRKFQNKFNKKSDKNGRFAKKQKFGVKDVSGRSPSLDKKKPTLLQKLLNADVERDKSHLFQVFRFMVMNSFFKHFPDKPLVYPSVVVKEIGCEVDGEDKLLHTRKDDLERGNQKRVQKIVTHNNDNGHDSEDEESDGDENDSIVHINLLKRQCDDGEGIEESDEEEGEILD